MSRTVKEIYDEMIGFKESSGNLDDLLPNTGESYSNLLAELTATSKVAIWRLWCYVIAVSIFYHEQQFDNFVAIVEDLVANAEAGTPRWYQEQVLKFQYSDTLVYQANGRYEYNTIDTSLQVVKRCAIQERPDGVVVVKTAKLSAGLPVPLSSPELTSLQAYMRQIKFAGTRLSVVSFNADSLKVYYTIYYDPIIDVAIIQSAVEAAINNYIQNLPFNGAFNITKLTDALEGIEGVIDPIFNSADARYGALPYAPILREYVANAGYLEIDGAYPLSTTITYIPII
jgi:hypothetical protein